MKHFEELSDLRTILISLCPLILELCVAHANSSGAAELGLMQESNKKLKEIIFGILTEGMIDRA